MDIDLESLITTIRVHPMADEPYYSSVESLLKSNLPVLLNRVEWPGLRGKCKRLDKCIIDF